MAKVLNASSTQYSRFDAIGAAEEGGSQTREHEGANRTSMLGWLAQNGWSASFGVSDRMAIILVVVPSRFSLGFMHR